MIFNELKKFYQGKRVFITGHTGFKGTWLCRILLNMGAIVTGYALQPPDEPNLFRVSRIEKHKNFYSVIGDVRDLEHLTSAFKVSRPEIVIHLAAQPIVRESYKNPVNTYSTNVMGTVNVLECIRTVVDSKGNPVVRSFLNVTTDKVYKNNEWFWGYRENEPLDGLDPYSNSKSCSELVTHAYKDSFFYDKSVRISTARAGNVIGGGDFAKDRIIPDCVKMLEEAMANTEKKAVLGVRNPYSIRPYQHVFEPLMVYLTIAMKQYQDENYDGYYNVGPDDCDCITTGELITMFCQKWNLSLNGYCGHQMEFPSIEWRRMEENTAPHEASFLKLECSKLKAVFGWKPKWKLDKCIEMTVKFYKVWLECKIKGNYEMIQNEMDAQISEYIKTD